MAQHGGQMLDEWGGGHFDHSLTAGGRELDAHAEFVFHDGGNTPGTAFDRAAAGAAGGPDALEHFRVLFDFTAEDDTELPVTQGDTGIA